MNAPFFATTFDSPLGKFSCAVDAAGALVATAFGDFAALRRRLGADAAELTRDDRRTARARAELTEFLAGRRRAFTVGVAPRGTEFQRRVWNALREIPVGETRSYGQLAKELRTAARAVGRANATNPVCVVIPCHRVIGADGSLTGFAFGEETKRRLLDLERRAA